MFTKVEGKMKELLLILLTLIFTSSGWASVYKWVDERGVLNFADDYNKVPPDYRNHVDEISIPKSVRSTLSQTPPGNIRVDSQSGTQAPPIAQPLIREGDFAIKLVEKLNVGQTGIEAEAESMLVSAGVAPKNGWIADYPVTPDVIGELERAIGEAADAGKLPMGKSDALKVFRTTALELELPIVFEGPDRYAESPSPPTPQYTEPSVINDYYYTEGPPVVTYYPPPPDYAYLYGWIPSPFWYSGFSFPGFYILHDFNRVVFFNRHPCLITNHIRDHRTGRIFSVDPARRHEGGIFGTGERPHMRGFNSTEARNGARSIFERSRERAAFGNPNAFGAGRGLIHGNPPQSRSGWVPQRQAYHRESRPSGSNGRNNNYGRPPLIGNRTNRSPGETRFHGMNERTFSRREPASRQYGANLQRPPSGEIRSFSPSPRTGARSFQAPSQAPPQTGGKHLGSSPFHSRGFSGTPQTGGYGGSLGHGGPRF